MKPMIPIVSWLLFVVLSCQGQNTSATLFSTESILSNRFLAIDALSNRYYEENGVLFKKNGDLIWQYKNLSLGKIVKIDVQNPLKIGVFFEGFNSVVVLDNQLNEIQKVSFLNNKNALIVSAIGIAAQNKLWFYDTISQKIGLFNCSNDDFKFISTPLPGNFRYYQSDFNHFQWIDSDLNWYSCTLFGTINWIKQVPDFDKIQIINSHLLLYSKGDCLFFKDFKSNTTQEVQNVDKSFDYFIYKDQILSIFTHQQIKNYKIIRP
jgi:hypothetical protein